MWTHRVETSDLINLAQTDATPEQRVVLDRMMGLKWRVEKVIQHSGTQKVLVWLRHADGQCVGLKPDATLERAKPGRKTVSVKLSCLA